MALLFDSLYGKEPTLHLDEARQMNRMAVLRQIFETGMHEYLRVCIGGEQWEETISQARNAALEKEKLEEDMDWIKSEVMDRKVQAEQDILKIREDLAVEQKKAEERFERKEKQWGSKKTEFERHLNKLSGNEDVMKLAQEMLWNTNEEVSVEDSWRCRTKESSWWNLDRNSEEWGKRKREQDEWEKAEQERNEKSWEGGYWSERNSPSPTPSSQPSRIRGYDLDPESEIDEEEFEILRKIKKQRVIVFEKGEEQEDPVKIVGGLWHKSDWVDEKDGWVKCKENDGLYHKEPYLCWSCKPKKEIEYPEHWKEESVKKEEVEDGEIESDSEGWLEYKTDEEEEKEDYVKLEED